MVLLKFKTTIFYKTISNVFNRNQTKTIQVSPFPNKIRSFLDSFLEIYVILKYVSFYCFTLSESIESNTVFTTVGDKIMVLIFIILTGCQICICFFKNIFFITNNFIILEIGNIIVTTFGTILAILHVSIIFWKRIICWKIAQIINSADYEVCAYCIFKIYIF